jgi:phage terminase large subunit-like protein
MTSFSIFSRGNAYQSAVYEWRLRWLSECRPEQLAPAGNWRTWALIAGRGFGKTRVGAEDTGYYAAANPGVRVAVVSPTNNDCRAVCFEGESGLLEKIPRAILAKSKYRRDEITLTLPNGSMLIGYSAEKPDRLRGPQHHRAWGDELASWGATVSGGKASEGPRLKEAWSNLDFGLRLGTNPQILVTTTPRPIKFIRELIKNPRSAYTRGSTFDNAANLAGSALETFRDVYEGTRLGRQELYGDILGENENALWKYSDFDREGFRLPDYPKLTRIVVAVDPAVTDTDNSDETGIIVAARGEDDHVYILHDGSLRGSPRAWARQALALYERFNADCIVGETNQGGDLVETNLRAEADGKVFRFKGVHAKRGKYLRAEPVAAYYEKQKVHHVGRFDKLESQMCEFTGSPGDESPDRLDALVYAVTELLIGTRKHAFF